MANRVMENGKIGDPCMQTSCMYDATHIVFTQVKSGVGELDVKTAYCLKDALYFAAWLPYCYPDEYTLVSITPPASELFNR